VKARQHPLAGLTFFYQGATHMATAAPKKIAVKTLPSRRATSVPNAVSNATDDAAQVIEEADEVKISLDQSLAAATPQVEELVTVIVPKPFKLTLDDHSEKNYPQGIYEMPVDHAGHWWARVSGVKVYTKQPAV
jgi:hypothetical protein